VVLHSNPDQIVAQQFFSKYQSPFTPLRADVTTAVLNTSEALAAMHIQKHDILGLGLGLGCAVPCDAAGVQQARHIQNAAHPAVCQVRVPIPRAVKAGPPDIASKKSDEGFVLVTVVGLLLVLAIMGTSLLLASRSDIKVRAAQAARSELAALADGGIRLVAYRLAQSRSAGPAGRTLPVDGTPLVCQDGAIRLDVRVNDSAGLVDVNYASTDVLQVLITGLGVPESEAGETATAIANFRSPTAFVGQPAGRPYRPKNAPLERVDELDQVLGISTGLLNRLRPLITVHSRSNAIDPSVAPVDLLRALRRDPAGGGAGSFDPATASSQIGRSANTRASRNRLPLFVIRVSATAANQSVFVREAVVELTRSAASGFIIRDWSSPAMATATSGWRGDTVGACEDLLR
jgi:general secretion pathway protein K